MNFRMFLTEENSDNIWFEKIPQPEYVGNALMAVNQIINSQNEESVKESYGDITPKRGYPMSQQGANLLSVVPNKSKASPADGKATLGQLGAMVDALDWLMGRGLYESLIIRKKMANKATQDLLQSMGEEEFRKAFQIENNDPAVVTEDVVYNKKAHDAIPALKQWYDDQDQSAMEPTKPIKISSGRSQHVVYIQDINSVINDINSQSEKIQLENFKFAGPNGQIEWIEDGSWAEQGFGSPMNQSFRTKNGISLHDPQTAQDPKTGNLVYKMGGIVSPLRNLQSDYDRKLRNYLHKILADTYKAIEGKVDVSTLTDEEKAHLESLKKVYEDGSKMSFDPNSFASMRGHAADEEINFEPDNKEDYAAYLFIMRLSVAMRIKVNDQLDKAENDPESSEEEAINILKGRYGLSTSQILGFRGKNRVTDKNKDDYERSYGTHSKDQWATGKATIRPAQGKLPASGLLSLGYQYLKNLLKNKQIRMEDKINEYIGNDLKSGKLGDVQMQDIVAAVKNLPVKIPQLGLGQDGKSSVDIKSSFGKKVSKKELITYDQLNDLLNNGWKFQPDATEKKGATIDDSHRGRLISNSGGMKILSRKNTNEPWQALDTDSPGDPVNRYVNDVPLLMPSSKTRFATDSVFDSSAPNKQAAYGTQDILQDIEYNPKQYGYNDDESFDREMLSIAKGMSSRYNDKGYDHEFKNYSPSELAYQLKMKIAEQIRSKTLLKYGLFNTPEAQNKIYFSLMQIPGIDKESLSFWTNRMSKYLKSGDVPVVKGDGDYSIQNWRKKEGVPEEINHAFLLNGRDYRKKVAKKGVRRDIVGNPNERQMAVGTGKQGEEIQQDVEAKRNNAEIRMAAASKGTGAADNVRNRVGINPVTGFEEPININFSADNSMKEQPFRKYRNSENNGAYMTSYRQVAKELEQLGVSQVSSYLRTLKPINNEKFTGKLDAIADKFYNLVKPMATGKEYYDIAEKLEPLYTSIGSVLDKKYKLVGDNIPFDDIMNLPKIILKFIKSLVANKESEALELRQQQTQQAAQEYEKNKHQNYGLAASNPKPEAPATPNIKPIKPTQYGLGSFIKPKENYSFRSRYFRTFRETDAIFDKSKPITFNWMGAVGKPGGKVIDGEVKTNGNKTKNK